MRDLTLLIKPASSLCNMRCDYCFYADLAARREVASHGIMSEATLDALVRRAFAYAEESVTFVFQGGEPLLAGIEFFKWAMELQRKYKPRGVRVYNSLQTNGVLIDDAFAEFFAENGFLVGVSLDGTKAIHDRYRHMPNGGESYREALRGIERLKARGVEFNVLCVVSADVARAAREVYAALRQYGHLQFIPLIDEASGEARSFTLEAEDYGRFLVELFEEYHADIRRGSYTSVRNFDAYINALRGIPPSDCALRGRCGGYFALEADGSVYPCDFYVTDEYRLGNVCAESFFALEKSERLRRFVEDSTRVAEKCRTCRHFPLCRGGCRRYREPFPALSKFCAAYKAFFDASAEKMARLARDINSHSLKDGASR